MCGRARASRRRRPLPARSACGDRVRLQLRLGADGRIEEARYSPGCTAATAAAAWFAERAEGASLLTGAPLSLADCLTERETPDDRSESRPRLDALAAALAAAMEARDLPLVADRVAVAMSGGVDSAVALQRIVDRGDAAVGITLRLWIAPRCARRGPRLLLAGRVRRARATCHALGVPHLTLDARDGFRETVVQPFLNDYQAGLTPEPLARRATATSASPCWRRRRAGSARHVRDRALRPPCRTATVRWSRVVPMPPRPVGDARTRGPGAARDAGVPASAAPRTMSASRPPAPGWAAANAPESQDVCFLGGGDLRGFLDSPRRRPAAGRDPRCRRSRRRSPRRRGLVHGRSATRTRRGRGEPQYARGRRRCRGRHDRAAPPAARREVELVDATLHRPVSRVHARLRVHMADVAATVEPCGGRAAAAPRRAGLRRRARAGCGAVRR